MEMMPVGKADARKRHAFQHCSVL